MARKIAILGTGGTIAGKSASAGGAVGYQAAQIGVADLLQPVTASLRCAGWELEIEQVLQLDSKDMDIVSWQTLARTCAQYLARNETAGLVITHGTDTLEETAWFLQCVLQPRIPVVMTCAMRPADALSADGPANLRDAVLAVAQAPAGVWMVAAGELHAAQWVRKVHPYRVNAFASLAHGPVGWVEEGQLRGLASAGCEVSTAAAIDGALLEVPAADWPWVEVLTSTAAARPGAVDALVAAGVQGLVVACTGNGSIHRAWLPALQRAQAQGVVVWRTTRCEQGQIVLADGEVDGAVSPLSPVKARISLMLQLLCAQQA